MVKVAAELARANLSSSKRAALLEQERLRQVRYLHLLSFFPPKMSTCNPEMARTFAHSTLYIDACEA